MTQHFEKQALDSPRRTAEMLLAHVIGCDRLRLYMEPHRPATPGERDRLRALVQRADAHEPIDYLVGESPFFAMMFHVSPDTLVPRPSTEALVEFVLHRERPEGPRRRSAVEPAGQPDAEPDAHRGPGSDRVPASSPSPPAEARGPRIADIGTGSGCIAVALAGQLERAEVIATDLYEPALAVARVNAQRHGVAHRIRFRQGDLLSALAPEDGPVDYLLSNPPYIPDDEWPAVARNVKDYEPHAALRGGVDGLDRVRPIVAGGGLWLRPGGWLVLEVAASRAEATAELVREAGFEAVDIHRDHEDLPRVVVGRRPGGSARSDPVGGATSS